jgi:hypothetical protein
VKQPSTSPKRRGRRVISALALIPLVAFGAAVATGTASAAKAPPSTPTADAPHCLAKVIGRSAAGELQLSTPACYATYGDVLSRAGQPVADKNISPTEARTRGLVGGGATTMSSTWIIGTHFDGAGWTGASFSVEGSDCGGGYLNLTGWWANRVSSTLNGCPTIVHYLWPNLVGSNEATTGVGGNLWSLNNLSESIQYTS